MRRKTVSGIMLSLLLVGMLILTFNIQSAKASGTITINADGSIVPPTANITSTDNVTYYFTGNINESIVVERDNIVVDGNGYILQGTASGSGFRLGYMNNVTIQNTNIKNFTYGIYLYSSSNNTVSGNNITNNGDGIWLTYSSNNSISGNNITNNGNGIYLSVSSKNTISGNNMINNDYGIMLSESSSCTVSGNNITANNWYGIYLYSSSNNTVSGNNITANNEYGIYLFASSHNTVSGNNITNNWCGIPLYGSHNTVSGNNITNNPIGIYLSGSSNSISGNNITNNKDGIVLEKSSNNTISRNTVTNNVYGIELYWSSNNSIYHNNFVDNSKQVYSENSKNVWDDGYPSGGNYWSDHVCTGNPSDGSQPYIIDANNIDHYPFQDPNSWLLHQLTVTSSPITGITFTVDGVSRTTPWSGTYSEGASVSLVMPETHNGYVWSHWLEDGNTNRTKTVTIDTDITLTAVFTYVPPVGGKAIPIDKPIIKPELQIPWIWLSTIILSLVVTVVYVKKRKRNTRTLPYVKC